MRKFGIIFGTFVVAVALLIAGGVAWYRHAYPTYTYRFRLAIAVDVGGQTKTASSVIGVKVITQDSFLPQVPPIRDEVHGDAVFLDLGGGKNLFALLSCHADASRICVDTLVTNEFHIGGLENLPRLETLRGSRELTGEFLPTLITFHDLADPKSARSLSPNQFEQIFGPDVHFKRAWIEMTDDPVTRGIEKQLPWITQMKAEGLGDRIEGRVGEFRVNVPYFTRG